MDVSTPLTRERYTGNRMGAMQARRPDAGMVKALLQGGPRYDHPGLDGFWIGRPMGGELGRHHHVGALGRSAARALCRRDGVRFPA